MLYLCAAAYGSEGCSSLDRQHTGARTCPAFGLLVLSGYLIPHDLIHFTRSALGNYYMRVTFFENHEICGNPLNSLKFMDY
jgi:hypothetical protein